MPVEIPETPHGHAAGPYSPAVRAGDWIVLAGQGGIDPGTGGIIEGGIEAETRQTLEHIRNILGDCGASMTDIAKVTVYLADMDDFQAMNGVYAEMFDGHKPARTTIQAARLPFDLKVEIEVWAYRPAGLG